MIEKAGPYPNNAICIVAHTLSGAPIETGVIDKIIEAVLELAKKEQIIVNVSVE